LTANPQTYSSNGQQVSIYRDDKGCIINCDHLNAWLSSHSDPVEPYYTQIAQPSSKILAGDVIIFGFYLGDQYHHATFVASGSGYNVELNAHTNARYHYPITFFLGPNATEGQYTEMTCYHISTTGAVVTPPPSEPHYGTGCGFYPTQPYIHEKQ
jgi:hypothetical protein